MKRILFSGILAASVVAGYLHWRDSQQQVYSINVGSFFLPRSGWSAGPWRELGTAPYVAGFRQRTMFELTEEKAGIINILATDTYTDFELGRWSFSIHADMYPWMLRLGNTAAVVLLSAFFLMITTPRQKKVEEHSKR